MSYYNTNLDKNEANYVPLSPLTFLERTKDIYPNYEAVVYESRSYTWKEVYKRCVKFASALDKLGVKTGDTVSVMAFNTPEIFGRVLRLLPIKLVRRGQDGWRPRRPLGACFEDCRRIRGCWSLPG